MDEQTFKRRAFEGLFGRLEKDSIPLDMWDTAIPMLMGSKKAKDKKDLFSLLTSKWFEEFKKENPARAQRMLDNSTNSLLDVLNDIQFNGLEDRAATPLGKKAVKELPYKNITIPFGKENAESFVTPRGQHVAGVYGPEDDNSYPRLMVGGSVDPYTLIHEGRHSLLKNNAFMNRRDEETTNRAHDYMDAVKGKDKDRMDSTMHFLGSQYGMYRPDIFKLLKDMRGQ